MPDIYQIADRQRRQLLAGERKAAANLVQAYGAAWQRIKQQLDGLGEQIAAAKLRGEEVSPAWLFQEQRLQRLQAQAADEIARWAQFAGPTIAAAQAEAVQAATEHAQEQMAAALGPAPGGITITFARLPAEALQSLVGFLADGSPLSSLLDQFGPEAGRAARQALITGLATGQGMPAIARALRSALGTSLMRGLTIARTETLRSYREASRQTYVANDDVVRAWQWSADLNSRTCAYCLAMDGSVHPLTDVMATHPRCRCAQIPVTRSWSELGFPGVKETRPPRKSGAEVFASWPATEQRAVLGPGKYALYEQGKLALSDLIGQRRDPQWGPVGYERSLADILGGQEQRKAG